MENETKCEFGNVEEPDIHSSYVQALFEILDSKIAEKIYLRAYEIRKEKAKVSNLSEPSG